MEAIALLKQTRKLTLKIYNGLSQDQMLAIPEGFNNNLLWNLGHVVITQQLLCYKLSGNDMLIDDGLADQLRKGTGPKDWEATPDVEQLRELAVSLPERLEQDYAAGLFKDYNTYETSAGVTLNNIDDAINFNNFHEGIHVGYALALKRAL